MSNRKQLKIGFSVWLAGTMLQTKHDTWKVETFLQGSDWHHHMRPLYVRIARNLYHPMRFVDWGRYQLSRGNDIHLLSLPSSGTHWLRMMIAKSLVVAYELDYEFTGIKPHGIVPTFRAKDQRFIYNHRDEIPRVQHSHKAYSFLYRNERVILLIRDLRDTMVSSYDTYQDETESPVSFSEFLRGEGIDTGKRRTLADRVTFLNKWYRNQDNLEDYLIVRFEELNTDTAGTVESVVNFIDIKPVTDEVVNAAVEFGSLENMQRLEQSEEERGKKVNEGSTDRHNTYFTPEDERYFSDYVDEHLVYNYGYDY
jgi:hypothetical protein